MGLKWDGMVVTVSMMDFTVASQWARWRLKSPASRLLIQPLCEEFSPVNSTHKWPVTRKMFSIWWRHHEFSVARWSKRCEIGITYALNPIWIHEVPMPNMYETDTSSPTGTHQHLACFNSLAHDDVIKWKHFPRNLPFVRGIDRSPVNSPHKGQWRGALMFSLICVWINDWVNNREDGQLRRYRAHYDVIVMPWETRFALKRMTTIHFQSQCWTRSMLPYGVTGPQGVNYHIFIVCGWYACMMKWNLFITLFLQNIHKRHSVAHQWTQSMGFICDSIVWFVIITLYSELLMSRGHLRLNHSHRKTSLNIVKLACKSKVLVLLGVI